MLPCSSCVPRRILPLLLTLGLVATGLGRAEPLRVGVEPDLAPIEFVADDGRPHGFAIDLMNAIASEMQFDVTYVVEPRSKLFDTFYAGRIDALANVVATKEREPYMAFSVTDVRLRNAIFVRQDGPSVTSLNDLLHARTAVVRGGRSDEYFRRNKAADLLVPVGSVAEALHAVAERRADAAIVTRVFGAATINHDHLKELVEAQFVAPDSDHEFHFALHPEDRLRLAAINEGLQRIRANGVYDDLYERWIGPLEPRAIRWSDLQPYLVPTMIILVLALGLLLWQRRTMRLLGQQAEALRRSEQRLTLVLEGGDHGLWDWDVVTGTVERNTRSTSLLGYADNDIPPTHAAWMDLVHPEDRPSVEAAADHAALAMHDAFAVQYRMKAKDGQWRWIVSRGKVLDRDAQGRPKRAAGTHTDVTAQKRMEEERVAFQQKVLEAQKLESLGLLAGGIAHDFNNLLTVVLGQSTFLRVAQSSPEQTESALQQIESAARRASDLCRQMLVYAGGGSFAMQTLDLNALLTGMAPLLRHSVRKDAHLEFDLAGDLPQVEGDPTQLRQIVMNLVINASEALPPGGGRIDIVTAARSPTHAEMREAVHVSELPPGQRVSLTVRDNGSGMTPTVRTKIFEPFFTTKFTGRGLGLAAVLGIVRAHRGVFTVHSEAGAGSSFTLFLAAATVTPSGTPPINANVGPTATNRAKILVADDEPAVLAMSVAVLKHHGYEVVSAANGREAVERFAASPSEFGAVVLDFTMPELNGVGALMEIRRSRPNVPAVLMSGFGPADAFERLPPENPPLFLQKPFAQHELLARVTEAVALGNGTSSPTKPA